MQNLELVARLKGLAMEIRDEPEDTEAASTASVLETLVEALLESRASELAAVVNLYFVEDLEPLTVSVRSY